MQLYGYWRSSAAYRVRIALALKALPYVACPINLAQGAQQQADYRTLNPQALVPLLIDDDGTRVSQSLSIIEYLDDTRAHTPLLPPSARERARVRALALSIACDIHPLNNLRVLNYLTAELAQDDDAKQHWIRHWLKLGLDALEATLSTDTARGRFCHGDTPTLADCCLIPQLYNARRFGLALNAYPTLGAIEQACAVLPAFTAAHPDQQADAPRVAP